MLLIFNLFHCSGCFFTFDFTDKNFTGKILLNFAPQDYYEIKLKAGTSSLFSSSSHGNIVLDVDVYNSDGSIISYENFNLAKANLCGIYYKTKNYTLKILNDGYETDNFAILFSNEKIPSKNYQNMYRLDILIYTYYDSGTDLSSLKKNFIYLNHKENTVIIIAVFFPVVTVAFILFALFCQS